MLKIPRFAVMGAPIAHSLSPLIHYSFAKQTGIKLRYDKLYVKQADFAREITSFFTLGGVGLNITSPLKTLAYQSSAVQTTRCQAVQSANTLWYADGKLHADNTDGQGLIMDLQKYVDIYGQTILILGAGGAALGIIPSLLSLKPHSIAILNRTQAKAVRLTDTFANTVMLAAPSKSYDIIINATPSNGDLCCDETLKKARFCYDLRYAYFGETPFTARAKRLGIRAKHGLGMLINQAALSFEIWHGLRPDVHLLMNHF